MPRTSSAVTGHRISREPSQSAWRLLLRQFASPIILILLAATVVSMIAGDLADGLIILAIVIPSGLLGFWQEHRADRTMAALRSRLAIRARVRRDGSVVELAVDELALGDIVLLSAGDIVPADLELLTDEVLELDESAITGESFAAEKSATADARVYYGSHVVSGKGEAKITALGAETKFGSLVAELQKRDTVTAFEAGITRFGQLLMRAMLLLVLGILTVNIIEQRPVIDSLLFALALAVGLTPQLLPVIISVSLSTGARALAKAKVLVKRLDSIEDFGSIDVLCTDKTGTLTIGAVRLDQWLDPAGSVSPAVAELARVNAKLQTGFANPMDAAIIAATDNLPNASLADYTFWAELPYDFERRRLSVAVSLANGSRLLITKGAFESVLALCPNADAIALRTQFETASSQGFRVLAIATKTIAAEAQQLTLDDERELEFAGLLLFLDPPKPDAAAAITDLKSLGIDLFLITGDNPLAAKHIGAIVGLDASEVITGTDFAGFSAEQKLAAIESTRLFAEFDPLQKEQLVKLIRSQGHSVGYFGDGINDSAALKAADVGISVDTAVDVARQAASVVLLDRDLGVIASGVRLGRKTFVNTMKYVRVGVSAAFGNVLSMAVAAIFLPFLPLLPSQILLLNFLTDFPAVMIAGDNVDREAVTKPRAWDIREIRNFMLTFGLLSSVFDILTFAILKLGFNADAEQFRSGWFIESSMTEIVVMLLLRTNRSIFSREFWMSKPGRGLFWSSMSVAAIVLLLPFTPVASALGLEPLPSWLVLTLLGLTLVYAVLNDLLKRRIRS